MATWMFGDIAVTRIEEQLGFAGRPPEQYLAGFDRNVLEPHLDWLVPDHYSPTEHRLVSSIHSWLIRTPRQTILVDSCGGNDKHRPGFARFHQQSWPYIERLAAAGVAPVAIDIVLCTHLHSDHVGWNTRLIDGRWVPTFPNARYLMSRTERETGDPASSATAAADPQRSHAWRDSVLPVIEHGQVALVDGDHALDDGLTIVPAPGHTAGHIALWVERAGRRGVLCGDAIHHAVQIVMPQWNSAFDEHPETALATRRHLLGQCAERGAAMLPGHFGAPHVARIVAGPHGFAPRFAQPDRA